MRIHVHSKTAYFLVSLSFTLSSGCSESPPTTADTAGKSAQASSLNHVTPAAETADSVPETTTDPHAWPQFRGPAGLAVCQAKHVPAAWSDEKNVIWKLPLVGAGTSSPVVFGDRIFVTLHTGYGTGQGESGAMSNLKRFVICVSRSDGKILWRKEVKTLLPETEYGNRMLGHGYASSTPAVDARRVYCFFGKSGVVALDHDGNEIWTASVGTGTHDWGSAASPVLVKNLVIINAFPESGCLIALDRKTGQEMWRKKGLKETWSTPLIVTLADGHQELVLANIDRILGFDPATGGLLWACEGTGWYSVASMVANKDIVYCMTGKGVEQTVAVRAGGHGDVTDTHVVWRARKGSNVSSPVYYDGHLYFAHESQGIAYCLDAANGEVLYETRLPRIGMIYASPIIADGKIYYVSREKGTVVLAAKPEYELLEHNKLANDHSVFNASPVISHSQLLLRSNQYLYCIGTK